MTVGPMRLEDGVTARSLNRPAADHEEQRASSPGTHPAKCYLLVNVYLQSNRKATDTGRCFVQTHLLDEESARLEVDASRDWSCGFKMRTLIHRPPQIAIPLVLLPGTETIRAPLAETDRLT